MIRKAVIPVAGRARRMCPISSVVPKALLALPDRSGRVRPVLHWICAEAAASGVGQVVLVVAPDQQQAVRTYFDAARRAGDTDLPDDIEYVVQDEPRGLGDAVLRAGDFVGDEPFVLLLGDHVQVAAAGAEPCTAQVILAWHQLGGVAVIGMQDVGREALALVGVARGEPIGDRVYRCVQFVEKPDPATAQARLRTEGLAPGRFLAHCGVYVLGPQLMDSLRDLAGKTPHGSEVELADAQKTLLQRYPGDYYLVRIAGRAFDVGTPAGYVGAFRSLSSPNQGDETCSAT